MNFREYECVFFSEKLGMLFNVHESKATIIGLDSHQYQQQANPASKPYHELSTLKSEPVEEENHLEYNGVITLVPSTDANDPTTAEHNPGATQQMVLKDSTHTNKAAELLTAMANMDSEPTMTEESSKDPEAVEPSNESDLTLPGVVIERQPSVDHCTGLIETDSYEDFQTSIKASANATRTHVQSKHSTEPVSAAADTQGDDLIAMPMEIDTVDLNSEPVLAMESPFDNTSPSTSSAVNTATTSTTGNNSAAVRNTESPPALPTSAPTGSPPAVPRRPAPATPVRPPLAPPQSIAAPAVPTAPMTPMDSTDTSTSTDDVAPSPSAPPATSSLTATASSRGDIRANRQLVCRLFNMRPPRRGNKYQLSMKNDDDASTATRYCEGKKWLLKVAAADDFIGNTIEAVNGVQVRELDGAFQLALVKQRNRPLFIKFRSEYSPLSSQADANMGVSGSTVSPARVAPPNVEKFKYALFMAKYTSTAASKIRSTVDSTLQDYIKCDWADVKAKGEGLPQVTIVSIYKYIEYEMQKLDLFTHSHARGYGVPVEMQESHWADVRGHIESLVYRSIGPHTRTLWPIFSSDDAFDRDEFRDAESGPSDLKANTFIGVDLSISSGADDNLNGDEPEMTGAYSGRSNFSDSQSSGKGPPMVELSAEHPLRMKLAYLRFVTLESTGLDCGDSKPKPRSESMEMSLLDRASECAAPPAPAPEVETPEIYPLHRPVAVHGNGVDTLSMVRKMRQINRIMLRHKEEWYLAMRGLCRAMQLQTPGEVLFALTQTVKLISHALDAYLNRRDEHTSAVLVVPPGTPRTPGVCGSCDNSIAQESLRGVGNIACTCGAVHLVSENHTCIDIIPTSTLLEPSESTGALSPNQVVHDIFAGKRVLTACENDNTELNARPNVVKVAAKCKAKKEHHPLSADDLMPAITWVLIQANPPNIEYMVWMCTEFRHPSLLCGEEAFCLAQLSSAVEFCKHADHRAFDILHADYNTLMLSYNNTLKLLLACKLDNVDFAQELVANGNADVNGLSPDHQDSPLTACIRFGRQTMLRYLLSRPEIDVDAPVQLFHGPNQRCTPLMVATQYNQLEMVIDLLCAGADRNYCDDTGTSALTIAEANSKPLALVHLVLKADPAKSELVSEILQGKRLCAIGLLLQKPDVNYQMPPENQYSPLMAAVVRRDVVVIRFLLNKRLCSTDIDLVNQAGETALLVCAKQFIEEPSLEHICILAMLLRFGANRYVRDCTGMCAADYIRHTREVMKKRELDSVNPFRLSERPSVHLAGAVGVVSPFEAAHTSDVPPPPPTPPPPPPVAVTSAAVVTALTKRSPLPAGSSSNAGTPPLPSGSPPSLTPPAPAPVSAVAVPATQEKATFRVDPEIKRLLKEGLALLTIDPLHENTAPLYELSRDRKLNEVRALLYQGVDVNITCPAKGYSALIAAVYNSDIDMLKLLLQADALCKKTYYSTPFSILSAIKSVLKGTQELVEADAELQVNGDGVTEGEIGGYLRTSEPIEMPDSVQGGGVKMAGKSNVVDIDGAGRGGMRALHYASQIGNIRVVGALLEAGAAREVFNDKLHTPLDVCLANNHIEAANAIRFDPDKVSICLAAKHGDWVVMSALLCQGVSINTQRNHMSKTGDQLHHELFTPLLAAVAHGQTELVKQILEVPDINVNLANSLNQTALMFAAARGDENVVLLLLSKGADRWVLDNQGYIAAAWAESRNRDAITVILKHDPARVWIHDVIRNNDFAALIGMLKQKVDPNQRRYSKLVPHSPATAGASLKIDAVGSRSNSAVKQARRASAPASSTATTHATQGEADGSLGGNGFIHGETPLIVAARYGRLDAIAILLKAPAPAAVELNLTDNAGNTPLHHAALKGQEDAVLLLLKAHASRHARNLLDMTPAMVAKVAGFSQIAATIEADPFLIHIHDMCEQGDLLKVNGLLKQGCPVNYRDERAGKRLQTPLMAASLGGAADVVRMLLRNADVVDQIDAADSVGRTALMRAASVGALNVTALLLNAGCNRALKDKEGLTARDYASKHSYSVMFQFISQSMVR